MTKVCNEDENLYRAILQDLYQMGVVLHNEKFKILFWSYRFFFIGLLLSCVINLAQVVADSF